MTDKKEIKPKVETTGHSWDGIKEYNNPLPRWWLWTFYATIAWALIYTILYPAWPLVNGATGGVLGWSQRAEVASEIEAVTASQSQLRDALVETDLGVLARNEELHRYAVQAGGALYRTNCSQCHGSGAAGAVGYPNLLDDDWLWGGRIEDIALTIRHGIRNEDDPDARFSQMPAFGDMLDRDQIATLVDHVQSLPNGADPLGGAGGALFAENCASCHGDDARGDREIGATNLTDAIWLYSPDDEILTSLISQGPYGVMPAWGDRLGEYGVRAVAAYVHQLGGGEGDAETQIGDAQAADAPIATGADPSNPADVPFPEKGDGGAASRSE
ncbi:cytochrome-c oxidase, cbb3-type subunit III [Paracoccus sp. TK19116]|uniref:Cbb3-type cytochrome c oxidase subunit n=1 Tax=Paracoccus albicereus TaxID=2922394 RepID=A0ABT1MUT8_9RHOB|nr:cytochrome-c oxidase, cbb3-type subunit III [Paracoccus albicereus]MCQ0972105.1 cytochrome-c oxidase, cbb3-type subunit III [Paracoccus albicereus]